MVSEHWKAHYARQHALADVIGVTKSLEYSNEAVLIQTYFNALEGMGAIENLAVLDAGCGLGRFSRIMHALGARVTGVDFVEQTIVALRHLHPEISWAAANITEGRELSVLGHFDRIALLEVLQYSGFEATLAAVWPILRPGGRLIGCVPNSECPIVARIKERYQGMWMPVSPGEVLGLAESLPDVAGLYVRGLTFADDQSFLPMAASAWQQTIVGLPNRIAFVLVRR